MASRGSAKLHGQFSPGTEVRVVKVAGAHVVRPGPGDETVGTETVDKDGWVEFKGLEAGERYFAVGYDHGQPREVRLTARPDQETASHQEMYGDPGLQDRVRLGIGGSGGWADEPQPREDGDEQTVDGQTWLAQDQVDEGTVQRSDTLRGSAHPISVQEREMATRQWRKQEPVDQVVETPGAGEHPARTAEEPDHSRAATPKTAAKPAAKKGA